MIHQWFCGGTDPCACMESWKGLTDAQREGTQVNILLRDIEEAQSDTARLQERLHPVYTKRLNMIAGWLHQSQAVAERIAKDLEGAL